jgi:long-chain fatty acid transport protein
MNHRKSNSSNSRKALLVLLLIFSFAASSVYATNGYFSHGYGTHYKGLAGAGVALYLNTLGVATNPAGMAFMGSRFDVGLAFFNPNREYTVTGNPTNLPNTFGLTPGTFKSDKTLFLIPSLGVNFAIPGGNALTFSVYGNGGMNTEYPTNTYYGSQPTGVDLSQLFLAFTFSRQVVKNHALGITAIVAYQFFEARGLEAFDTFSSNSTKLTNKGHDTSSGFGVRIGYLGQILPNLSIGAAYQTEISMDKFSNYAGLFAEQGDFDIPASWNAGLAFKFTPAFTIAADVQQVLYSKVKSVGNPMLPNLLLVPLGADEGAGFGWKDMTVLKFGLQWEVNPLWTLRGGYSFGEQPIPGGNDRSESQVLFNILAPGVIEQHATVGFTTKLSSKLELNAAIMHGFSNSVLGVNPLEAVTPAAPQKVELKMNQWEGDISLSIHL